jgi:hypothetical protein
VTDKPEVLFDFGHGLNLSRAEDMLKVVGSLEQPPERVILDLRNCRHVDAGAAWRIGNVLRLLEQSAKVIVLVPEGLDVTNRTWYKFFTHSGLGFSIARYASEIQGSSGDMTDAVRAYYSTARASVDVPLTAWASSTFLYVPDLLRGDLAPDDPPDFNIRLRQLLATSPFDVRAYSRKAVTGVFRILYEAVQNVWDHADKSPLPPGVHVSSSFAIRHFKTIPSPKAATSEFKGYLKRVQELTPEPEGFIEIVVIDDGVGMAARYSQNGQIYAESFEAEEHVATAAFRDGHSVKLQVTDATLRGSPGYGFTKILDGLRALNAFTLVRSGRVLFFFDSTLGDETFARVGSPLGFLPGTALQIIFPRRFAHVWSVPDAD